MESNETPYVPDFGDVVKLGKTAQELHVVVGSGGPGYTQVKQRSTGKVRIVRSTRCILVFRP